MRKIVLIIIFIAVAFISNMNAQVIVGIQGGWAIPQGTSFEDNAGKKIAGGGAYFGGDILYKLNSQLAVGLTGSFDMLIGITPEDDLFGSSGIYSLNLYGAKGVYKLFDAKATPYFAISTGLAKFTTPEIMTNGNITEQAASGSAFGFRPELGINVANFIISISYIVPMKYDFTNESAGSLNFALGYQYEF